MLDEVTGDEPHTVLGADDRFELRPLALELLFALDLFTFSRFFELGVDLRPLGFIERQLRPLAPPPAANDAAAIEALIERVLG